MKLETKFILSPEAIILKRIKCMKPQFQHTRQQAANDSDPMGLGDVAESPDLKYKK